jgi:hypothetical protein
MGHRGIGQQPLEARLAQSRHVAEHDGDDGQRAHQAGRGRVQHRTLEDAHQGQHHGGLDQRSHQCGDLQSCAGIGIGRPGVEGEDRGLEEQAAHHQQTSGPGLRIAAAQGLHEGRDRQRARHAIGQRNAKQQQRTGHRRQHQVLEGAFRRGAGAALILHDQRKGRQREHLDAQEERCKAGALQDQRCAQHHRGDEHPELVALPRCKDQRQAQAAAQQHQLAQHGQAVDADLAGHDLGAIPACHWCSSAAPAASRPGDEDRARPARIGAQRFQQHQGHHQRQQQVVGQQPVDEVSCHGLPR